MRRFATGGSNAVGSGRLAFRVGGLAVLVGTAVTVVALLSVVGDCDPPPADPVCRHLITTLSERLGVVAAVVTVVVMLTMAGVARLSAQRDAQPAGRSP